MAVFELDLGRAALTHGVVERADIESYRVRSDLVSIRRVVAETVGDGFRRLRVLPLRLDDLEERLHVFLQLGQVALLLLEYRRAPSARRPGTVVQPLLERRKVRQGATDVGLQLQLR